MKATYVIATAAAILTSIISASLANQKETKREYTIRVGGQKGVKLKMLLVTKASATADPTRRIEVVEVPFETTVKGSAFYAWFDTLPGGVSGRAGDRIEGSYKVDGELQGGGFGGTLKGSNKQSFGLGNL